VNRTKRTAVALVGAAGLIVGVVGTPGVSSAASARTVLAGSKPSWATASHRVGSTSGRTAVDFKVYLPLRDEAAAAKYAMDVSTPGTAVSGKFLTPAAFRSRFAPTSGQVSELRSWLSSQGFKVTDVASNNRYVEATGTVTKAAAAFKTSFAQYKVRGRTLRSNTTDLSVPRGLGVSAVTGLDESYGLVKTHASAPAGFRNARPCSRFWGEKKVATSATPDGTRLPTDPANFAPCGYAGHQLQDVYGVRRAIDSGNDGSGVTVAVIDAFASSTIEKDLATYSQRHGLPALRPGQFRQVVSPGTYRRPENKQQDPEGWSGEETLDIEAVHTMAPGADIVYVGAPNNRQDLDAALNKVVDKQLADVVTNSYGFSGEALPRGYVKPFNDTLVQAAATGISVFFSSGDNGDETDAVEGASPTPDWPASSPWVTAVGGTSLGVAADGSREFEQGWETGLSTLQDDGTWSAPSYLYGSGGGTSRIFRQPSYQAGVVPDRISKRYDANGPAMRAVPDVSAVGDPNTGMLVGQTQRFSDGTFYDEFRIGGTSLSSPLYAGVFALAVQQHGRYGLANPALYAARGTAYDIKKINPDPPSRASNPETDGDVRVDFVNGENAADGYRYTARWFDVDHWLTIHVRNGYDDVTGVGSPNGSAWLSRVVAHH
jgi:subtilase family serine protease